MKPTIFISLILVTLVLFSPTDVRAGLRIDPSATTERDDLESIVKDTKKEVAKDVFKNADSLFYESVTATDDLKRLEELQRLKAEVAEELKHLDRLRQLKIAIAEELNRLEELQRLKMKMMEDARTGLSPQSFTPVEEQGEGSWSIQGKLRDIGQGEGSWSIQGKLRDIGRGAELGLPGFDGIYNREGFVRTGKDYALLFATNEYEHWPNLSTPIADAEAIGAELENRYGFNVDIRKNVTIKQILDALAEYRAKRYAPGDQLLVYFAGSGAFDEELQDGHIVGTDSELPTTDKHLSTFLSFNKLREDVDIFPCERIMLMLDVCYGGTFDKNNALIKEPATRGLIRIRQLNLNQTLKVPTRWYLSSGGKEPVHDGMAHSPFALSLLTVLRDGAGDDGVLTIPEIERLLPIKLQEELEKFAAAWKEKHPSWEGKIQQTPASGPFGSGNAADKAFVFIGKDREENR